MSSHNNSPVSDRHFEQSRTMASFWRTGVYGKSDVASALPLSRHVKRNGPIRWTFHNFNRIMPNINVCSELARPTPVCELACGVRGSCTLCVDGNFLKAWDKISVFALLVTKQRIGLLKGIRGFLSRDLSRPIGLPHAVWPPKTRSILSCPSNAVVSHVSCAGWLVISWSEIREFPRK